MAESAPRSTLYFDPNENAENPLKAFNDFCDTFLLRYDALYPDPPKVSLEAAITRWTYGQRTVANPDPKPNLEQYDEIRNSWRNTDKVTKFLGLFSSKQFQNDWLAAEPDPAIRSGISWGEFVDKMKTFYKPADNPTLRNYQFRNLSQRDDETFIAFVTRVEQEARNCSFKCQHADCTSEETNVRDQIVFGTKHDLIRDDAMIKSWDLKTLRSEGMKYESAMKANAEMSTSVNRILGKYSIKHQKQQQPQKQVNRKPIKCFNCGEKTTDITDHRLNSCKARGVKCTFCPNTGHYPSECFKNPARNSGTRKKDNNVNTLGSPQDDIPTNKLENNEPVNNLNDYDVNLFIINSSKNLPKPKLKSHLTNDFLVQVIVNNTLTKVLADTGAKVSVCSTIQAQRWGILNKAIKTNKRIQPYRSESIPVYGIARCAVSFGRTVIPVEWHIISGSCDSILSGTAARQLGIISFQKSPDVFEPINMISTNMEPSVKQDIQYILLQYPENFQGLGKLKDYQVKLHVNPDVKPIAVPPRPTPYHLQQRSNELINEMISNDVIEKLPPHEDARWVSCSTISPKPNGDIRMTLDARNVNKALLSSNLPIPRQEDIKAKLSGSTIFSKLDFKTAFWQLELEPESRYLTVFHHNGHLYRYKRLTMGLKPAQGELNAALSPIFAHINGVHLIHDDLVIATTTEKQHSEALEAVMKAVSASELTLNPDKCVFGVAEINFWGLIISKEGVKPDPSKVSALDNLSLPSNKQELTSFLCMLQANSEFLPNFSRRSSILRELTHLDTPFIWTDKHTECFQQLLQDFREATLLHYFDPQKKTFIVVDAHITGLGAMLAQGEDVESLHPVAFASRTTKQHEKLYPQLDLEAVSVNYGLTRFRNYLVGSPEKITVVTDHKPLCSIFNGTRNGSIRTERIKLLHQDIPFQVIYRPGKNNSTDYLSRNATPITNLPIKEQNEPDELNNLLYILHTTPIMDYITLATIAQHTTKDNTLRALRDIIQKGQTYIPKTANENLRKFSSILSNICVTGNGILLKDDRIILPESLHQQAIELAHRGSHPMQSGIQRRLRYHYFFHNMNQKVHKFVSSCKDCSAFTDKKTSEPISPHAVPDKNWSKVSVDLFGPMPSNHHVVMVQDLASRYPAGKIVTSTKASSVIPALADIYNNYGNPETQLSDNGTPFNSKAMETFCNERNIQQEKIPPLHPSANPVETFMKTLGKSMKIAKRNNMSEKEALAQLFSNYRDTPHPATGLSPNNMLFRDAPQSTFPRKNITNQEVQAAKQRDLANKLHRQEKLNASKYRTASNFKIGDLVMIRNFEKSSKFDPIFQYEPLVIVDIEDEGRCLHIQRLHNGRIYKRHPDDVKLYSSIPDITENNYSDTNTTSFDDQIKDLAFKSMYDDDTDNEYIENQPLIPENQPVVPDRARIPRIRNRNPRYYNESMINSLC